MNGHTITIEGTNYNLCDPTFEVLALSFTKLAGKGEADMINAGKVIFDACYDGDLSDIIKDTKLYISLCLQSATLIDIYEGDIKKN